MARVSARCFSKVSLSVGEITALCRMRRMVLRGRRGDVLGRSRYS